MKHATPLALDRLEILLSGLRKLDGLKEKSRGVFYRGSRAFLHFHESGETLFVDVRIADDFERWPVTTRKEQSAVLQKVRTFLAKTKKNAKRTS